MSEEAGTDTAVVEAAAAVAASPVETLERGTKVVGGILKETVVKWIADGVPARGAALAYYVLLSLGPFLVLLVGFLEFFVNEDEVRDGLLRALRTNLGARAAETMATVIGRVEVPDLFTPTSFLTVALLLFGATAAFTNVRGSLNEIWGVEPQEQSRKEIALDLLRARLQGFVMMLVTGLVLTVSFFITSATSMVAERFEAWLPNGSVLIQLADASLSLVFVGILFAAMYRTLPSIEIEWKTVWVGAFVTALFFVLGKWIVAQALANASWTSYYGPGASVVTFLAWIYFSAQIFYFGAEFTQVWSRHRGGVMADRSD